MVRIVIAILIGSLVGFHCEVQKGFTYSPDFLLYDLDYYQDHEENFVRHMSGLSLNRNKKLPIKDQLLSTLVSTTEVPFENTDLLDDSFETTEFSMEANSTMQDKSETTNISAEKNLALQDTTLPTETSEFPIEKNTTTQDFFFTTDAPSEASETSAEENSTVKDISFPTVIPPETSELPIQKDLPMEATTLITDISSETKDFPTEEDTTMQNITLTTNVPSEISEISAEESITVKGTIFPTVMPFETPELSTVKNSVMQDTTTNKEIPNRTAEPSTEKVLTVQDTTLTTLMEIKATSSLPTTLMHSIVTPTVELEKTTNMSHSGEQTTDIPITTMMPTTTFRVPSTFVESSTTVKSTAPPGTGYDSKQTILGTTLTTGTFSNKTSSTMLPIILMPKAIPKQNPKPQIAMKPNRKTARTSGKRKLGNKRKNNNNRRRPIKKGKIGKSAPKKKIPIGTTPCPRTHPFDLENVNEIPSVGAGVRVKELFEVACDGKISPKINQI